MNTITFDTTLKFAERLKAAGVLSEQAIAEAEALRDVLGEAFDTTLATKSDISEVKGDIRDVKAELLLIKWMLGSVLAVALANFAKQFF